MPVIVYETAETKGRTEMDEIIYQEDGSFIELPSTVGHTEGPRYIPIHRIYHIDFEENQ